MRFRAAVVVFSFIVLLVLDASAATAQDATGPCTASATLSNGVLVDPYDPALEGTVYEIPAGGSASYSGSVTAPVPTPRPISGDVSVAGPPGFGEIRVSDDWVWDNPESSSTSKDGEVSWKLPSVVPRGVDLEVSGRHVDANGVVCEGAILVRLEGGVFDSPLGYVAVGGTLLAGGLLASAMVAPGGSAVKPPRTTVPAPAAPSGPPISAGSPPSPPQPVAPPPPAAPPPPSGPPASTSTPPPPTEPPASTGQPPGSAQ